MKWLRRSLLIVLFASIVVAIVYAFRPKPIPVETAKVEQGEFKEYVEEPARTRVRERFIISAPVSGELARITRKPGDMVEEKDLLATIRPLAPVMLDARTKSELDARLHAARASHALSTSAVAKAKTVKDFAQKELVRIKGLVDKGVLAGVELEKAELDLKIAERDVRTAELSATVAANQLAVAQAAAGDAPPKAEIGWELRSPLRGRVLRVLQTSEGVVAAGTPLLEIADTSDLEVVATLLTTDALRVKPGASASLDRWGGPALEARVRAIEPSGYTKLSALGVEEQRVDVVLDIMSPPAQWASLGDGFRVHAKILVHREASAIKTAAAAVFRDGDAWAVFVVEGDRARKRRVVVERRNGPEAMLGGGAPLGATLISFPGNDIHDGARVVLR